MKIKDLFDYITTHKTHISILGRIAIPTIDHSCWILLERNDPDQYNPFSLYASILVTHEPDPDQHKIVWKIGFNYPFSETVSMCPVTEHADKDRYISKTINEEFDEELFDCINDFNSSYIYYVIAATLTKYIHGLNAIK